MAIRSRFRASRWILLRFDRASRPFPVTESLPLTLKSEKTGKIPPEDLRLYAGGRHPETAKEDAPLSEPAATSSLEARFESGLEPRECPAVVLHEVTEGPSAQPPLSERLLRRPS